MNTKTLNMTALIGSIMIFIASFLAIASNGLLFIAAVNAGGIWYLLPALGLAGIITSSMGMAGKLDTKVFSIIIGCIAAGLSIWFAMHSMGTLDQVVAMQSDMANGFNSSFFTGKPQDTSHLQASSFGTGFYCDILGSILLIASSRMIVSGSKSAS